MRALGAEGEGHKMALAEAACKLVWMGLVLCRRVS